MFHVAGEGRLSKFPDKRSGFLDVILMKVARDIIMNFCDQAPQIGFALNRPFYSVLDYRASFYRGG